MTFIIAEAGVNHNGRLDRALQMIDLAAEAGADAVKFQTFKAEKLVAADTGMAAYQEQQLGQQLTQLELLKGLELSPEAHFKMQAHCKLRNIEFMSTAFDSESLALLADEIKLDRFKISSGDMNNAPFVLQHARLGKDLIISTGMSTLTEIEQMLGVVAFGLTAQPQAAEGESVFQDAFASQTGRDALREKVTLLHCSTEYPVPLSNINLAAMQTLSETFGTAVGYSDHSTSLHVGGLAVAAGATLIEKHFTTDRSLPGPDHAASLTPEELTAMIENIRFAETVYGSKEKRPSAAELKNAKVARKVICARCDIKKGEQFSPENLTFLRSDKGVMPIRYWEFLSTKAERSYKKGDRIDDR